MTGSDRDPMPAFGDDENSPLGHALPTGHFDRLRFGLRDDPGVTQVWSAFVSIAMSAQIRGWTETEFTTEVTGRTCLKIKGSRRWVPNQLWCQLDELARDPRKSLYDAWEQAASNLRSDGLHTLEDLRATAVETAWAWADRLLGGVDGLDEIDARLMEYRVDHQVEKREMASGRLHPEVAAHSGVSHNTAHRRLKALTERRLLICHSPGWYSGPDESPSRRAGIYSLSDPFVTSPSNDGT